MARANRRTTLPEIVLLGVAALLSVWASITFFTADLTRILLLDAEYGPLETVELCLIVGCLALFAGAYLTSYGAVRVAAGALALLAATAFVRELDVKKLSGPEWYRWLADRGLQEILFVGMSFCIFAYLWRHRRYASDVVRLLMTWYAWPLFAAGGLILTGQYIDRRLRTLDPRMGFIEVIVELLGYVFLVIAALRHLRLSRPNT
jgi:hypothetical protein